MIGAQCRPRCTAAACDALMMRRFVTDFVRQPDEANEGVAVGEHTADSTPSIEKLGPSRVSMIVTNIIASRVRYPIYLAKKDRAFLSCRVPWARCNVIAWLGSCTSAFSVMHCSDAATLRFGTLACAPRHERCRMGNGVTSAPAGVGADSRAGGERRRAVRRRRPSRHYRPQSKRLGVSAISPLTRTLHLCSRPWHSRRRPTDGLGSAGVGDRGTRRRRCVASVGRGHACARAAQRDGATRVLVRG